MKVDWQTLIEKNPLLASLPEDLKVAAKQQPFAEGQTLFLRGTRPKVMLYVLDGELRLIRHTTGGGQVILQRSRKGFVAEASMESKTYHCDVVASEAGRLLTFPIPMFRRALDDQPAFRRVWMSGLAVEVRRLRAQNERLHLNKAADRVRHYIESEGRDGILTLLHSRKAWAVELGLSHEALYRTLAKMEADGFISVSGDTISVNPT
ncbi:MAG: Crp/Fnr family transcriptional regulator [Gallionella sp.]|jgi:CRP-like cAMP-binding protein